MHGFVSKVKSVPASLVDLMVFTIYNSYIIVAKYKHMKFNIDYSYLVYIYILGVTIVSLLIS